MNYLQRKKQANLKIKNILPSGYRKVEYLQGTGAQYIDLGTKPTSLKYYIEQTFQNTIPEFNDVVSWYGSMPSDTIVIPRFSIGLVTNKYFCGLNLTNMLPKNDTNKHIIAFDGYHYNFDGNIFKYTPSSFSLPILTSYLFARHGNNGIQSISAITKIYNHKEYNRKNGELLVNLIPCLDNSNRPCMFDLVRKKTLYNKGTGEFIYGEVIN